MKVAIAIVCASCAALMAAAAWFLLVFLPDQGVTQWNDRGDAMAPFGSLFTALAFAAAAVAVLYQRDATTAQTRQLALQLEELKLQREELRHQREEAAETRKVLDEQRQVQEEQARAQHEHAAALFESNALLRKQIEAEDKANQVAEQLVRSQADNNTLQEQANKFTVYSIEAQREVQRATLRMAWATLVTKYYELNRHVDDKGAMVKHIGMVEEEIDKLAFAPDPYNGRGKSDRVSPRHPGSFRATSKKPDSSET